MLTPQEISEKEFVRAVFGGYDMSAVDDFLESLTADYSLLYKENAILKSKIKVLVEKVEEYRSTEDAMRMALLTAQKMGDDLLAEAHQKSDSILDAARVDAEKKMAEYARLIREEENRLTAAKAATAEFVSASQAIIGKHSDFLSNLDALLPEEPEEEPVPVLTREEQILGTAREIDSAMAKITGEEPAAEDTASEEAEPEAEPVPDEPEYDDESEPTKVFPIKDWSDDDDDAPSPKPTFNFDNLKFGTNYTEDDD